jgi:uncharacterized iron-regulated protein
LVNCRFAVILLLFLAGCATPPRTPRCAGATLAALLPADALLVGEQHDAAEHHRLERALVETLAARGQLAALVLEMADAGQSTASLTRGADEADVRTALAWNDAAWPWLSYGPAVMAAVRAGVPVLGGNLPARAHARRDGRRPAGRAAGTRRPAGAAAGHPRRALRPSARIADRFP